MALGLRQGAALLDALHHEHACLTVTALASGVSGLLQLSSRPCKVPGKLREV